MMNEAAKPDSDSLMALQALLKIRSHSAVEAEETVSRSNTTMKHVPPSGKTKKPTENRKSSVPLAKQQALDGQPLSHVTPPFGAMSPRSALSPSFTLNYDMQNSMHLQAGLPIYSPVATEPIAPVAVPSSVMTLPAQVSVKVTQDKRKKATEDTAAAEAIRLGEIEAALKSKPQRGRKRDNLSALERLELTRTRNREHAKSTR